MAASSSTLSNFLSFIFPSKPPPPPKTPQPQLNLLQTQKPREGLVPLVAQEGPHSSSSSLASVICPSLAYANTLYFNSAYNVQVVVEDNESEERLLNRFRREVMRAGVIQECKRRRYFENKQDEKKRRTRDAAKRNKRRRPQFRGPPPTKPEESVSKKADDEEDNWDLPEGSIPY
ncbi:hypothetical protein FH972_007237 [Carpinus fangiana]|uniref:30S ribosomal protein S21, chloroplastic n=1 Tax=Carpinus fangiana TaxID=176857 RepID=A0A5N6QUY6_9ROSI|nr:hypothetical protein FH972_007237 [Carpinus fangiana]